MEPESAAIGSHHSHAGGQYVRSGRKLFCMRYNLESVLQLMYCRVEGILHDKFSKNDYDVYPFDSPTLENQSDKNLSMFSIF